MRLLTIAISVCALAGCAAIFAHHPEPEHQNIGADVTIVVSEPRLLTVDGHSLDYFHCETGMPLICESSGARQYCRCPQ